MDPELAELNCRKPNEDWMYANGFVLAAGTQPRIPTEEDVYWYAFNGDGACSRAFNNSTTGKRWILDVAEV